MRHVEKALEKMKKNNELFPYMEVQNLTLGKNPPSIVKFVIQEEPIGEVGVNGCQARDMLEYLIYLFTSFNETFPCRENSITITKLQEALMWQDKRTQDREKRGVEGKNEE